MSRTGTATSANPNKYRAIRSMTARDWTHLTVLFVAFFIMFRWYPHVLLLDRLAGTDLGFYLGTWALEPNSLVVGRLAQNDVGGIFSDAMSIGFQGSYTRQFGLSAWLLTVPATLTFGLSPAGVGLMVSLACALSAALAAGATLLIAKTLGRGAAALMGLALLLPWSVAIARSMYWTIGIKLLPAAMLIWVMRSPKRSAWRIALTSLIFSAISALSGYEYFTVTVATQLAVIAYYSVSERWAVGHTIRTAILTGVTAVGGFIVALGLHLVQLYLRAGDFSRIQELQRSALSRTGTGTGAIDPNVPTPEALSTTPASVLDTYLAMPIFGVRTALPVIQQFTVTALLFATAVIVIAGLSRMATNTRMRREQALGIAWFVALLGPLGWFLLARPHSVMHTFMNFALWFTPTVPLAFALIWAPIGRGLRTLRHQPVIVAWLALTLAALVLFFAFSQLTVQ